MVPRKLITLMKTRELLNLMHYYNEKSICYSFCNLFQLVINSNNLFFLVKFETKLSFLGSIAISKTIALCYNKQIVVKMITWMFFFWLGTSLKSMLMSCPLLCLFMFLINPNVISFQIMFLNYVIFIYLK